MHPNKPIKIILLIISLGLALTLAITRAQSPEFGAAFRLGANFDDRGYDIVTDAEGNFYAAGMFQGKVNFEAGKGTTIVDSGKGGAPFIAKYMAAGTLAWAKGAVVNGRGSGQARGVAIDQAGNVYLAGYFQGTLDFGKTNLTSAGNSDLFVAKLDKTGNFLWVKGFGGTGEDEGQDITVDEAGNVYVIGSFENSFKVGTVDLTSAGATDIFVLKLDRNGEAGWAKGFGGSSFDEGNSLAIYQGHIYATGSFENTLDNVGQANIFIFKLTEQGNTVWAKAMPGTENGTGRGLAITETGEFYVTGQFAGEVDFDPGPNEAKLQSTGDFDIFVTKLSSDGNFVWVKAMGGISFDSGNNLTLDDAGNIYTIGIFHSVGGDIVDFDPGPDIFNPRGAGSIDIFLSKLDKDGHFVWAGAIGGPSIYERGLAIALNKAHEVYITGYFEETVNFNPGFGSYPLTSAGKADVFIAKFNPQMFATLPPKSFQPESIDDTSSTLTATVTMTLTPPSLVEATTIQKRAVSSISLTIVEFITTTVIEPKAVVTKIVEATPLAPISPSPALTPDSTPIPLAVGKKTESLISLTLVEIFAVEQPIITPTATVAPTVMAQIAQIEPTETASPLISYDKEASSISLTIVELKPAKATSAKIVAVPTAMPSKTATSIPTVVPTAIAQIKPTETAAPLISYDKKASPISLTIVELKPTKATPAKVVPTATPSKIPTVTPSSTATPAPSKTATMTPKVATAIPTTILSKIATMTATPIKIAVKPTATPAPSLTLTPTAMPSPTLTPTATPSPMPTTATTPILPAPIFAVPNLLPNPNPAIIDVSGKIAVPIINEQGQANIHIFTLNFGYGGESLVVPNARQPHLRADGQRMLIKRPSDGQTAIFEYNFVNGTSQPVGDGLTSAHPFYAPGGHRLVYDNVALFGSAIGHDKLGGIVVPCGLKPPQQESDPRCQNMAVYGVLMPVSHVGYIAGSQPIWASNDTIIYRGCNNWADSSACGLYGMDRRATKGFSEGGTPRQLTYHPSDTTGDAKGGYVVFSSSKEGNKEIYVMGLDGNGIRNLVDSPSSNEGWPTISPNGNWVAFVSDREHGWAVWAVPLAGGGRAQKLFDLPAPAWNATDSAWTNERLSWGP